MFLPSSIEVFTSSTCNLDCTYCYISKNDEFFKFNKEIIEAHKNRTYLNQLKDLYKGCEDRFTLFNFWGGEPLMGISLMTETIEEYLDHFPRLNQFYLSSNMTCCIGHFLEFLDVLYNYGKKNNRKFDFTLQVSIDGPPNIMNLNRVGLTEHIEDINKLIEENIVRIVEHLDAYEQEIIFIHINFKPTLSVENIDLHLKTEDDIIDFFSYFEELATTILCVSSKKNIQVHFNAIPNFVCPGQYTKSDGLKLAEHCKRLERVMMKNKKERMLPFYEELDFLSYVTKKALDAYENNELESGGFCGSCRSTACINHKGTLHVCHRGLLDSIPGYVKNVDKLNDLKERQVITTDLEKYVGGNSVCTYDASLLDGSENKFTELYDSSHMVQLTCITALIDEMLLTKQISDIYRDPKMKTLAALFIKLNTPCLQDNAITTGTLQLKDASLLRFTLNGAFETLYERFTRDRR